MEPRLLFTVWQFHGSGPRTAAGAPATDGWALTALGRLGNDDTVRRLVPVIREWPGQTGHAKAVTGLDVLAEIGSDLALMYLSSIAQRVRFKALRQRAQEKIADVAASRGLTAEQLADRLVPDFGLDEDATLVIDYGSGRFTVGFDEQLRSFVVDQDGRRRNDLPKPGDDEQQALAEYQRSPRCARMSARSRPTRSTGWNRR